MKGLYGKSLVGALLSLGIHDSLAQYVPPTGSPGFYHGQSSAQVTFDQHSLFLGNNRTLFLSGEFHPFRLPSPQLWKDILQKFKAAGLNGVSVYWHWGLTSPREGVNRFTHHNDIVQFLKVAQDVGLLVLARPGPYINAETAGGGLPGWLTNVPALARTNQTGYHDAWVPYIKEFAELSAPFQYPNGPLIGVQAENEFGTSEFYGIPGLNEYMQQVIEELRAGGLNKVPTTFNDNWPKGTFAGPGLGQVDLYGWDGYPAGFDCSNPDNWVELDTQMHANHLIWAPYVPLALWEWQGGAFDYYGSGFSEDGCYRLTDEKFANVYYKNNYAGGAKLQNLYMTYGGTCWGNLGNEGIFYSYDYGAAIREDRTITPKLDEIKVQSYFLHASPGYLTADWIGAGSTATGTAYSSSPAIYTTLQHDSVTGTNFYFVRQATVNTTTTTEFTLRVNSTILGNEVTVPTTGVMNLNGRESKILVTDYPFGSSKLVFSTAEVLTWQTFDGTDYIFLYTSPNEAVEVLVASTNSTSHHKRAASTSIPAGFSVNTTSTYTAIRAAANRSKSIAVIPVGKAVIIVADKSVALQAYAPRFPSSGFGHYTPNSNVPGVWVLGPHLVRTAELQGSTLALTGDLNATSTVDIWGPSSIKKVTWNGKSVSVSTNQQLSSLHGTINIDVNANSISVPDLSRLQWKCADSIPEANPSYDDSTWIVANKTNTTRPQKPYYGAKYILYGDEYGYHQGSWVWRGYFDGNATGLQLAVQTGFSGAFTAFINGKFLGSKQGSSTQWSGVDIQEANYTFTAGQLKAANNVLTVYHDSTGQTSDYNVDDTFKNPRGVRGYKLISDTGVDFKKWTVVGNVGGEYAPDDVRAHYNEGGWNYERIGAHLPGFDDSYWQSCSPYQGRSSPGITAYRTKFNLNIPKAADVPLSIDLDLENAPYRVLIYANGWQYGRFIANLGPQSSFPIPEGILDHQGENEILIVLWSLEGAAKTKNLRLTKRAVLSSAKAAGIGLVPAPDWQDLRGSSH